MLVIVILAYFCAVIFKKNNKSITIRKIAHYLLHEIPETWIISFVEKLLFIYL
jgi:hypothetical protein